MPESSLEVIPLAGIDGSRCIGGGIGDSGMAFNDDDLIATAGFVGVVVVSLLEVAANEASVVDPNSSRTLNPSLKSFPTFLSPAEEARFIIPLRNGVFDLNGSYCAEAAFL